MHIRRFLSSAAVLAFLSLGILLSGCADSLLDASDSSTLLEEQDSSSLLKLRHSKFLSRAKTSMGKEGVELSVNMSTLSKQRVLERYKVIERFKVFERYKVVERYDYSATIQGGGNFVLIDTEGEGDFQPLFDEFDKDVDILWYEPDFTVLAPDGSAKYLTSGEIVPWGAKAVGAGSGWKVDSEDKEGVHVYVVDSGIDHPDVNVVERVDFQNDGLFGDPDGHGTHVAGLIGAYDNDSGILGIAPGVAIHDYRVLDANGLADVSVVIAAIEAITQEKLANENRAMVVNMSLGENIGTTQFTALDEAIEASINAGVVYVVAAGNAEADASFFTPAHVPGAITVGSFDPPSKTKLTSGSTFTTLLSRFSTSYSSYTFSWFSNYGPMVDVLAPGRNLPSLAPDGGLDYQSGTSMAAAHVTGIIARYLAMAPEASPSEIVNKVVNGTRMTVAGVPSGTNNRAAYILAYDDGDN